MRNKLILKCLDGEKEFTYNKAMIYTKKYKSKLNKSTLHSPRAAKIIFFDIPKQFILLVKMPIIHVDHQGTITVFTKSTIDQATLKDKYTISRAIINNVKVKSKLLENKKSLGLTKKEALLKNINAYEEEMIYLIDNLGKYTEGGGFNG